MEQYAPERITRSMATRRANSWVPKELREQAWDILDSIIPKNEHTNEPKSSNTRPAPAPQFPEEIKQLKKLQIDQYRIYDITHSEMRTHAESGNEKEAYERAKKIMQEIEPRIKDLSARIKAWEDTGELPVVPGNDEVRRGFDLAKELAKLRVQRSQAKKKGEAVEAIEKRIEEIKIEIGE